MPSVHSSLNPLLIPELFHAVLDFLAEPLSPTSLDGFPFPIPDPDSQRALAVLARTCRGFTEPALNLLWRRLDSLEPLLWCFTSRKAFLAGGHPLHPPSPDDWTIIRRYAHYIQQLEVHNDFSSFLLGCAMFEVNLFPNLKALKWSSRSSMAHLGISLIQPLLSPGIVVLDICGSGNDMALGSFLKACPLRCPNLTALGIYDSMHQQSQLASIYSRAFSSFKNLKSLHIGSFVSDHVLQHLLMSPDFHELDLSIWPYQLKDISPPPSVIPLCNIRMLYLRLYCLRVLTDLLRPGDQSFRGVSLSLMSPEFATLIGSFFTGLVPHPRSSSLRLLHLRNQPSFTFLEDFGPYVLSFDTFRPLTCHANLQELAIELENPISLSDEELVHLARNWPLLQVIELCYSHQLPHGAKQATFKGLLSLVSICPELHHVGLTLDGMEVPRGVAVESRSKTIKTLRFPNSPINDQARLVAKFLLTHFPSMTSISDTLPLHRRGGEWAKVADYIANQSKLEDP